MRRRDAKYVSGDIDANTGSSLYSRVGMIHMSIPSRAISPGSSVSNRFLIHGVTSAFCSRCVRTRTAGSGYATCRASTGGKAVSTRSETSGTSRRMEGIVAPGAYGFFWPGGFFFRLLNGTNAVRGLCLRADKERSRQEDDGAKEHCGDAGVLPAH